MKPQASYFINARNELNFGGDLTYYNFEPANAGVVCQMAFWRILAYPKNMR